jgi:hypothetical protein
MIDQPLENDDLDRLLRQAMKDRPSHRTEIDLATVAMQKGRLAPSDAALLMASRVNRWNRAATAVAVLLIVVLSVWVFHSRLAAGGFQSWMSQTSSDTSSSTTANSSTTTTEWMLAGGVLAMGALVVVLCQRAINSSDEWMPWGAQTGGV